MIKQTITLEDKVMKEIVGRLQNGAYDVIETTMSAERHTYMTSETQQVVLVMGSYRIVIERERIRSPK